MTDRAVSVAVNYVLTLLIATVLLGGLVMAAGGVIESQSNNSVHDELGVIGERLAADIESADRLRAAGGEDTSVSVRSDLPNRVSGTSYTIEVNGDEETITLGSQNPEVTVRVSFAVENVESTRVRGGAVVIASKDGKLEVRES
ncbi:DUF7266 family protein [Natronorarus salvus]|uniref:DUF7266 family protein n=1 Tax=Natronorarus salvus TaxID=3117733 RepID=UPI002F2678C1